MDHNRSLRKTVEVGIFLSTIALTLAACGGGGSGGTATPTAPALPNTPTLSTNEVEKALADGIYHLWGFGYTLNGVPQVFISKTEKPSTYYWNVTQILGASASSSTSPRLDDGVTWTGSGSVSYWWSFPASSAHANLSIPHASSPSWTFTLNQQDISGQTVLSQIKKGDGSLLNPALADASAVFPAGSIAYTATLTAASPTFVNGWTLRGGSYGLEPVTSEAGMYGTGWCQPVVGQTYKLGVRIDAANTITLFNVASTCTFTGLTPIGTGSWTKEIAPNGDVIYRLSYPADITSDPAWIAAFTNSYSPRANKTPDLIFNPASSTSFSTAFDVPVGSTYTSLQPFFNPAALSALRAAAGI